jgi:O-Antigen ligase
LVVTRKTDTLPSDTAPSVTQDGSGVRSLPAVALVVASCLLAWVETGSIDASDWLLYAVLAALLLGVIALTGSVLRPLPAAVAGLALLLAYSGWQAVTIAWSALPALARDDALLTLFYAVVTAIGLLSVRSRLDRAIVVAAVAAGSGALALAMGVVLRFGGRPEDYFGDQRLTYPVSYTNGAAAMFLIGFWPALVVAARRSLPLVVRGVALGAAAATMSGWLLTQSKGAGIALAISTLAMLVVARDRLRLVLPELIVAAIVGLQFDPLTAPFSADGLLGLRAAARHAGGVLLWTSAVAAVIGFVYALVDRRFELPPRASSLVRRLALALVVVAAIAIPVSFFASVDHPSRYAADKWSAFKHNPSHETATTHFGSLGSNRYDFWRVGLHEFAHHPIGGIGGRGYGPAYLVARHSGETPARAHSFELDALSELGIVGFVLLLGGLVPFFVLVALGAWRGDLASTAAFGTAAYFVVHGSADWLWTIPAVGLPFFLLLGTACASPRGPRLGTVAVAGVATASFLVAFLAFAPPWLSARLTSHALETSSSPAGDLRWARRLDPLSVEPYLVEASVATTPAAALPRLQRAADKEPRAVEVRYQLGLGYLRVHRLAAARRELRAALRLEPGEPSIERALSRIQHR